MAVPFLSSITLNKNEVQDFKVFNYAGDVTPLTGTDVGYFWTNTTGGKTLRWWDGSAVRTVLDTSSSISGSQISGNITGGSGFVANALTAGSYLTSGGTFDGSVARTFAVDATDANTASKIVARDASGNFSAGTITASLSGNATTATTADKVANALTAGTYLTAGGTFDGSTARTFAVDATSANTASKVVARDASGNFSAGVITATNVTGLSSTPANDADAASKGYVDSVAQGLDVKASCLVATTTDITLSSPGAVTIDGIYSATDFTAGETRILVKDQSLSQQNGIYIWQGPSSAMTRSADANTWDELVGAFTFVERGTDNADSGWVCNVNAGGTLGTTAVTWTKFSQAGSYTAGNGMVLSGGVFHFAQDTNYTAGRIPFASGNTTIGFSSNLSWDNTNNRLGIGTAPLYALDVAGDTRIGGTGLAYGRLTVNKSTSGSTLNLSLAGTSGYTELMFTNYNDNTGASGWTSFIRSNTNAASNYASDLVFGTSSPTLGAPVPRMTLDHNGNLGLGVTPSAWVGYGLPIIELPNYGTIIAAGSNATLGANWYYSSGFKYKTAAAATYYYQTDGRHDWFSAPAWNGSGSNDLTFGTAKMTLSASGNLGVGVTSPTRRLHIYDSTQAVGRYQQIIQGGAAGYGAGVSFQSFLDGTSTLAEMARITADGEDSWNSTASTQDAGLRLYTALDGTVSERIRVMPSGQTRFSTNGTASAPTIANADNPDTGLYWPNDSDTLALAVGGSDAVYIDADRQVGLGTPTPNAKLHVKSNTGNARYGLFQTATTTGAGYIGFSTNSFANNRSIIGTDDSAGTALWVTGGAPYALSIGTVDSLPVVFATANTERLRIKSTGQLNLVGLASAPTGAVGDLYYNSTSNTLQYHNNSAFQQLSRKYTVALNDGSVTVAGNAYTLTHNMGSQDITVSVRRTTDNAVVLTDVSMPNNTTAIITFAAAITASQYVVTVIG